MKEDTLRAKLNFKCHILKFSTEDTIVIRYTDNSFIRREQLARLLTWKLKNLFSKDPLVKPGMYTVREYIFIGTTTGDRYNPVTCTEISCTGKKLSDDQFSTDLIDDTDEYTGDGLLLSSEEKLDETLDINSAVAKVFREYNPRLEIQ